MKVFYWSFNVDSTELFPTTEEIMEIQDDAAYFADKVNEKGKVISITETHIHDIFRITVWYESENKIEG